MITLAFRISKLIHEEPNNTVIYESLLVHKWIVIVLFWANNSTNHESWEGGGGAIRPSYPPHTPFHFEKQEELVKIWLY